MQSAIQTKNGNGANKPQNGAPRILGVFAARSDLLVERHQPGRKGYVAIFGSARPKPSDPLYETTFELSRRLALGGYSLVGGGGSGVMSATNFGAENVGGISVGIQPHFLAELEKGSGDTLRLLVNSMWTRKILISRGTAALVFMKGGLGTLDEFFDFLFMMRTGIVGKVPIVLMNRKYYQGFLGWLVEKKLLTEEETHRIFLSDSVADTLRIVEMKGRVASALPLEQIYRMSGQDSEKAERVERRLNDVGRAPSILGIGGPDALATASLLGRKFASLCIGGKTIELAEKSKTGTGVRLGGAPMNGEYPIRNLWAIKHLIVSRTEGVIAFPVGVGGLDALTELLVGIQLGLSAQGPVVLHGRKFWTPFVRWLQRMPVDERLADERDVQNLVISSDPHKTAAAMLER